LATTILVSRVDGGSQGGISTERMTAAGPLNAHITALILISSIPLQQ
jgi:hypothetical protein